MKLGLKAAVIFTVVASTLALVPEAQAQVRTRIYTENGTAGVAGGSNESGAAGCAVGQPNGPSGIRACGVKGTNGSASSSSGTAEGVGTFRRSNRTYTNPTNGNTVSGSKNSVYNAQTGQGRRSVDKSGTVNGTTYGYETDGNYTYTEGSGVSGSTTVNTENKGSYDCTYATGNGKTCTQF